MKRLKFSPAALCLVFLLALSKGSFAQSLPITGPDTAYPCMVAQYKITSNLNYPVKWQVSGGKIVLGAGNYTAQVTLPYDTAINVIWDCDINGPHQLKAEQFPDFVLLAVTLVPQVNTLSFSDVEMVNKLSKPLYFDHCVEYETDMGSCLKKKIENAELEILFNTGEDYEYGSHPFNAQVELLITGYAAMNSNLVVKEWTKNLDIGHEAPEQLITLDFINDYLTFLTSKNKVKFLFLINLYLEVHLVL